FPSCSKRRRLPARVWLSSTCCDCRAASLLTLNNGCESSCPPKLTAYFTASGTPARENLTPVFLASACAAKASIGLQLKDCSRFTANAWDSKRSDRDTIDRARPLDVRPDRLHCSARDS